MQEFEKILTELQKILGSHKQLHFERRTKLYCYYVQKKASKKLLFYINPRRTEIVFGIGHWGTDILEKFPTLPSLADQTKTSVMKFHIKTFQDIEKKAIKAIIKLILEEKN